MRAIRILPLLFLAACGTSKARQQLVTIGQFANDASTLMESFDQTYQDSILAELERTKDVETAKKKVEDYRNKRMGIKRAITTLQAVVAAGKPLLELVDAGKRGSTDWDNYLTTLMQLYEALHGSLLDLG